MAWEKISDSFGGTQLISQRPKSKISLYLGNPSLPPWFIAFKNSKSKIRWLNKSWGFKSSVPQKGHARLPNCWLVDGSTKDSLEVFYSWSRPHLGVRSSSHFSFHKNKWEVAARFTGDRLKKKKKVRAFPE